MHTDVKHMLKRSCLDGMMRSKAGQLTGKTYLSLSRWLEFFYCPLVGFMHVLPAASGLVVALQDSSWLCIVP